MLKKISEYSNEELLKIKSDLEFIPTVFTIDKETCIYVKEIAKKHGFNFSFGKKGDDVMFFEYNKGDLQQDLLNEDFPYKGFYFITMYNDIYLPGKLVKKDQDLLDVQFFFDFMQSYFYKLRFMYPNLAEISCDNYPYKKQAILTTYDYIWNEALPATIHSGKNSESEVKYILTCLEELFEEIKIEIFSKINDIYTKIDSM